MRRVRDLDRVILVNYEKILLYARKKRIRFHEMRPFRLSQDAAASIAAVDRLILYKYTKSVTSSWSVSIGSGGGTKYISDVLHPYITGFSSSDAL